MRSIGTLPDEVHARTFSAFLYTHRIENEVEDNARGSWSIWVHSEDQIQQAAAFLDRFKQEPEHPDFQTAVAEARDRAQEEREAIARAERKVFDRARLWKRSPSVHVTPILIALSVVAWMLIELNAWPNLLDRLFISAQQAPSGGAWWMALPEVRHGQIWRLVTPIFLHFNLLHLAFNMFWLFDLGGTIERRLGSLYLGILVLALAVTSNTGQYMLAGPMFGGMSGVVYGLLGYIWMKSRFDPGSGFFLRSSTVTMMLVWLLLCYTGLMGQIANAAHTIGLLVGTAWGWLSATARNRR